MNAFLGWGSLVWNPGALPIHGQWHLDGPFVRAELLRKSRDGRLTLVLARDVEPVRSLWASYAGTSLQDARVALCDREGIPKKNIATGIGSWSRGEPSPDCILELEPWAMARGVQSVVWTNLSPKFEDNDANAPSMEVVLRYLTGLTGPTRDLAEQYVRRAPRQIDTYYRRRIEAALGWSFDGREDGN